MSLILNYKKPLFWIFLFLIIIVAVIGIRLAANPEPQASFADATYSIKEILYQAPIYSSFLTLHNVPQISISSDFKLYSNSDWIMQGELYRYDLVNIT